MDSRPLRRRAFTLVELLVVITIIGVLISLLLPAVQGAREAARRTQCQNNLKQISLAFLAHEHAQGFLPTGGWGYQWIGDPDRGFTRRQGGGWAYNCLPYLEQTGVHDTGAGLDEAAKAVEIGKRVGIPLPGFNCPTRRRMIAYPCTNSFRICTPSQPKLVARTDYAANMGTLSYATGSSPGSYSDGDALTDQQWLDQYDGGNHHNGVCFRRSMVKMAEIRDGPSNTYMVGERNLNPDFYSTGTNGADDQCLFSGFDRDVVRNGTYQPVQDRPGLEDQLAFGSAHATGWNVAMCDGSVRSMSYNIDLETHHRLSNRKDGLPVSSDKF